MLRVSVVPRLLLGAATLVLGVVGLLSDDPRWLVASGSVGALWWAWDLVYDHVLLPIGEFIERSLVLGFGPSEGPRLSIQDTMRLLERRVRSGTGPVDVQIRAAVSLARYRLRHDKDPERAREILRIADSRFPGSPVIQEAMRELDEL